MSATLPNTDSALPLSADGLSDHPQNSTSTTPTTAGPITDAGSQCKSTCRFTPESLNAPNALTTPQRSNDFEQSPLQSATAGGQKPLIESDGDRSRPTDLPAALDELDAKDKRIAELEYQVNSFREGLQLARDLYREKSGKPDRLVGEDHWWNNPDDQCVVLWLIEWAEDIQCDLVKRLEAEIERLRRALLRIANGDFMGAGSLEIARAALEGRECERA